jgi:hypothetical protein
VIGAGDGNEERILQKQFEFAKYGHCVISAAGAKTSLVPSHLSLVAGEMVI